MRQKIANLEAEPACHDPKPADLQLEASANDKIQTAVGLTKRGNLTVEIVNGPGSVKQFLGVVLAQLCGALGQKAAKHVCQYQQKTATPL